MKTRAEELEAKRPSLFALGITLIRHHLRGWKKRPGYTVAERYEDGSCYITVWM